MLRINGLDDLVLHLSTALLASVGCSVPCGLPLRLAVRQNTLTFHDLDAAQFGRYRVGINTAVWVFRLGTTLIDTGPPNQRREVLAFAQEKPLDRIVLTHHHEDHSGNAAPLAEALEVLVLAPPRTIPFVRSGFPVQPYRRLFWGKPTWMTPAPLPQTLRLGGGLHLHSIHAPGHAPDMVCLLIPERGWLFSADLFVARTLRYFREDECLDTLIESTRTVLAHDFDTLLCAHRGVVEDGKTKLGQKLGNLVALREQIQALGAEGLPPAEITRRVLGSDGLVGRVSLGHFSKRNLVQNVLAHADLGR